MTDGSGAYLLLSLPSRVEVGVTNLIDRSDTLVPVVSASTCQNDTNALACRFSYSKAEVLASTVRQGVVLQLSYGERLPRTQNQCMSLVGAGMSSNAIRTVL